MAAKAKELSGDGDGTTGNREPGNSLERRFHHRVNPAAEASIQKGGPAIPTSASIHPILMNP